MYRSGNPGIMEYRGVCRVGFTQKKQNFDFFNSFFSKKLVICVDSVKDIGIYIVTSFCAKSKKITEKKITSYILSKKRRLLLE